MSYKIICRNEDGSPSRITIDDGFMQTSRPYDPETDGWMEQQLSPRDFPAVQTGRDMEFLIMEVNELRREVFRLTKDNEKWRKSFMGEYRND